MKTVGKAFTLFICSCSAVLGQVTVSKIFGEELPREVLDERIKGNYQGLKIKILKNAKLLLQKPKGKAFAANIRREKPT